jgi:uncharacterized protein
MIQTRRGKPAQEKAMKRHETASVLALTTLFLLAAVPRHSAAEVACKDGAPEIEALICKSEALQKLDTQLNTVYKKAVEVAKTFGDGGTALNQLKTEERGWIKGRNECWKAEDKSACTDVAYRRRISELEARFMLVTVAAPVYYICNGNQVDQIVVSAVASMLPSLRIERGDSTETVILEGAADGRRYAGNSGVEATLKGSSATVVWKDGVTIPCEKAP